LLYNYEFTPKIYIRAVCRSVTCVSSLPPPLLRFLVHLQYLLCGPAVPWGVIHS